LPAQLCPVPQQHFELTQEPPQHSSSALQAFPLVVQHLVALQSAKHKPPEQRGQKPLVQVGPQHSCAALQVDPIALHTPPPGVAQWPFVQSAPSQQSPGALQAEPSA
jgi:hypothetical protein